MTLQAVIGDGSGSHIPPAQTALAPKPILADNHAMGPRCIRPVRLNLGLNWPTPLSAEAQPAVDYHGLGRAMDPDSAPRPHRLG